VISGAVRAYALRRDYDSVPLTPCLLRHYTCFTALSLLRFFFDLHCLAPFLIFLILLLSDYFDVDCLTFIVSDLFDRVFQFRPLLWFVFMVSYCTSRESCKFAFVVFFFLCTCMANMLLLFRPFYLGVLVYLSYSYVYLELAGLKLFSYFSFYFAFQSLYFL
jgi:hypothetical protein